MTVVEVCVLPAKVLVFLPKIVNSPDLYGTVLIGGEYFDWDKKKIFTIDSPNIRSICKYISDGMIFELVDNPRIFTFTCETDEIAVLIRMSL
jgi:hypothetical protein